MKIINESQITQIELSIEIMMYGHAFICVAQEGTSVIVSNSQAPAGYEGNHPNILTQTVQSHRL